MQCATKYAALKPCVIATSLLYWAAKIPIRCAGSVSPEDHVGAGEVYRLTSSLRVSGVFAFCARRPPHSRFPRSVEDKETGPMAVADKILVCRDCGAEFVFTVGEQSFYAERGFVEPARCPNCRAARRQQRGDTPATSSTTSTRTERQLYPAICAECGKETLVPFEPRQGRPVYCRDCYQRLQS